jgi:hypothetical protein
MYSSVDCVTKARFPRDLHDLLRNRLFTPGKKKKIAVQVKAASLPIFIDTSDESHEI